MRAPEFWKRDRVGLTPAILTPVGWIYGLAGWCRTKFATAWKAPIPVICIGNLVAGGAGKTPVARDIGKRLNLMGRDPHFLSRGYGGWEQGPHRVDPRHDPAGRVGDEPLLLARTAPTWVSRNRPEGARAALEGGAGTIVMDDGFQNPSLGKDLSIVVVDGRYGFGNGRLIPAGPLREFVGPALARAGAVVILGPDEAGVETELVRWSVDLPVLKARIRPDNQSAHEKGKRAIAFSGIGMPEKFAYTLHEFGWDVIRIHEFADHHAYHPDEITRLKNEARRENALLVTTEKDIVRLPADRRDGIEVITIGLHWKNEADLNVLLETLFD